MLARNGTAPVGDLRYLADTKLAALATPIAKAQLAAALGLLGDKLRADRVFQAALDQLSPQPKLEFGREDYGSALRDAAALVTLASESNAPRPTVAAGVSRIEAARQISVTTSTQENAWLALAARAIAKDAAGVAVTVNGTRRQGPLYRSVNAAALQTTPLSVANNGEETLQAVVSVTGAPIVPEPAAESGFKIERNYFTLDGEAVDIATAKQNSRYAVVLKITEAAAAIRPDHRRRLPAGRLRDRQSAAGLVRRHRHARLDPACQGSGACRIPRRSLHRGFQSQRQGRRDLHGRLCRARGGAGHAMCIRRRLLRTCTAPTGSGAPRPARSR